MRILLCNKFYYRRGGDCTYTMNLESLLKERGHEVAVYSMQYPENEESPWSGYWPSNMSKLDAFVRPFGSSKVVKGFSRLLDDFRPDVVHLNNIHTQLSPVIAQIAHERGIKVLWTVHDYKLLCPRYDCLRNGKSCELCFSGDKSHSFRYSCIKGSKIGSWIGKREAEKWNRERLDSYVDYFVCPSRFMAGKMLQGGFSESKLVTLHNFIDVSKCDTAVSSREPYYCYVGRLSEEKGVRTLLKVAARLPYRLKVAGDGPLAEELRRGYDGADNIEFLGRISGGEVYELMSRSRFSVITSEWYENNPFSVIESLCMGTPVVGAEIGGIPELIADGVGFTFGSGDAASLAEAVENAWNAGFDYAAIRSASVAKFSSGAYYDRLMALYGG